MAFTATSRSRSVSSTPRSPLTTAETASVFGEALTFKRLLAIEEDPNRRLNLLAGRIEDSIATVFRQIAMNRFEDTVHTTRRDEGELSPEKFEELWLDCQAKLFGDSVDIDGYATWWSYIPHFIGTPGYVYAYSYGFLFALSIFRKYELEGESMVEPYLDVLRAGGSKPPEELARDGRPRPHRSAHLGRGHRRALHGARRGRGARRRHRPVALRTNCAPERAFQELAASACPLYARG